MISKILDMIEKLVQPQKQEEPMAYFGVPITGINANTSAVTATIYPTQYTQGLSAQNTGGAVGTYNVPTAGIGIGGAAGSINTIYGQAYTTNYQANAYQANASILPMMSGVLVSMGFIDANGLPSVIMVDQAYMQILQDISRNLQMTYGNQRAAQSPYAGQPHLKMLDGDFSEEEMTEAEGIIAELEGRHGPEAPHP